jgi:hypothetical protein
VSDEWYTPKHIFDALGLTFDLDPCSPPEESSVPAKQTYSLPFDGLAAPWHGLVWMNPPYSRPAPWVAKWLEHGNGLALLPMAKSKWFVDLCNSDAHFLVLPSTLKFNAPNGTRLSLMMGSTLWAIGDQACGALPASNLGKVR